MQTVTKIKQHVFYSIVYRKWAVKGIGQEMFIFLRLSWGPVVKTLLSNTGTVGLIPGQGVKIPQRNQNVKEKQ